MTPTDPIFAPMPGADHRVIGGVTMDIAPAGNGRVKRVIYPAGFRWSNDLKSIVGTDQCMHAHVGFLVRGRIHVKYTDGCVQEFVAPQAVTIDPGHDGWVDGDEPAVLIEFDFLGDTAKRFGLPEFHRHS
jgi:hypothetical protein